MELRSRRDGIFYDLVSEVAEGGRALSSELRICIVERGTGKQTVIMWFIRGALASRQGIWGWLGGTCKHTLNLWLG